MYSEFDQDINSWDVSKGVNFVSILWEETKYDRLKEYIFSHNFHVFVISQRSMFMHSKFDQNINSWDVSKSESFVSILWEEEKYFRLKE